MSYFNMKCGCTPKRQMTMVEARSYFNYDPTTGLLSWKELKVANAEKRGATYRKNPRPKPGAVGKDRYMRVKVDKATYRVHVICYNYIHGIVPDFKTIDHRDRDPSNNRISNLRCVTQKVNNLNRDKSNHHPMLGKTHSAETKANMSLARKGVAKSAAHRASMSKAQAGKVQEQVTCPHCEKSGGRSNMKRYHFDNCKQRKA